MSMVGSWRRSLVVAVGMMVSAMGSATAAETPDERQPSRDNEVQISASGSSKPLVCPPPGFDSVKNLDLKKYIAAPWYIQQQMVVSYQPEDTLYCVRANYRLVDPDDMSKGIIVENYANKGKVNGEPLGTSGSGKKDGLILKGIIPDPNVPSKLLVGPAFLERLLGTRLAKYFFGDYWVVAVGESDDPELGYDWAIVSGGAPARKGVNGCRTGSALLARFRLNGDGLWLFSRKPVDPENTAIMRQVAKDLGFDISVLRDVAQNGCKYEGAL